jgi:hypothetical protein
MAVSEAGRLLSAAAKASGLSNRQLGAMLGVSDRMVRAIRSGERPGRNVEAAARQLAREGRVSTPPTRRVQRVRAPGGATRAVEPVSRRSAVESGGRAQSTVDVPRRGPGRYAAKGAVAEDLKAHRGQHVTITVESKAGNRWTLGGRGGYDVATVLRRIRALAGDDPLDWIVDEAGALGQCGSGPLVASNIASVTLTYF